MFNIFLKISSLSLMLCFISSCTAKVINISDRMSDQMMKTDVPFQELDNISKAKREGRDNITSSPNYNDKNEVQIYGVYVENKPKGIEYKNAQEEYKDISKKVNTKFQLKNGYPEWFYYTDMVGYKFIAIGVAGINIAGFNEQKITATNNATKELTKKVRAEADSEFNVHGINSGALVYKSSQVSKAREKTDSVVKTYHVVDEWINPATFDYYVIIGVVDDTFKDTNIKHGNDLDNKSDLKNDNLSN